MLATINTLNVQSYLVSSSYVLVASNTPFRWIEAQIPEREQKGEIF